MGYRSASPNPESNPTHLTNICLSTMVNSPRFLGKTYSELNLVIYHLLPLCTHKSSLHPLLAQSPNPLDSPLKSHRRYGGREAERWKHRAQGQRRQTVEMPRDEVGDLGGQSSPFLKFLRASLQISPRKLSLTCRSWVPGSPVSRRTHTVRAIVPGPLALPLPNCPPAHLNRL